MQPEVGAGGDARRREVHDLLVPHVGVGEDDDVDVLTLDEVGQLGLVDDRDSLRIKAARELGRIAAPVDVGDLRRGEGDHLVARVVAEHDVEVVEVTTGRTEDDDACGGCVACSWRSPRLRSPT